MPRFLPSARRAIAAAGLGFLLVLSPVFSVLLPTSAHARGAQSEKAEILAEQAMKFHFGGKPELAIELYRQAYKLDPQPGYLYSAARAAHKAGKFASARHDYEEVLHIVAVGTVFHVKAKARLKELPDPEPVGAGKPGRDGTVAKQAASNSGWRRPAGWTAIGVSVFTLTGALMWAISASTQAARLDSYKLDGNTYDQTKITPGELAEEESNHNMKVISAWSLGAVGSASAFVGAMWLMHRDQGAAVASIEPMLGRTGGRGLLVTLRW